MLSTRAIPNLMIIWRAFFFVWRFGKKIINNMNATLPSNPLRVWLWGHNQTTIKMPIWNPCQNVPSEQWQKHYLLQLYALNFIDDFSHFGLWKAEDCIFSYILGIFFCVWECQVDVFCSRLSLRSAQIVRLWLLTIFLLFWSAALDARFYIEIFIAISLNVLRILFHCVIRANYISK